MSLSDRTHFVSAIQTGGEGPQTGGVTGAVGEVSAVEAIKLARRSGFKLEVDGDDLAFEAPNLPRSHAILGALGSRKPEVVSLLREERRAVVRWINDRFQPSPLGQCAHCGCGGREGDPFVAIFVGENRADVHASCHPAWIAAQEVEARVALGVEMQVDGGVEPDAATIETRAR